MYYTYASKVLAFKADYHFKLVRKLQLLKFFMYSYYISSTFLNGSNLCI